MINLSQSERNPGLSLLLVIVFALAGLFVFQFVSAGIVLPLMGFSLNELGDIMSNPTAYPSFRAPLVIMQGIISVGAFIVAPLYYIWRYENADFQPYFDYKEIDAKPAILTVLLVLSFMMVNSLFIEWNLNVQFPDFMSSFAQWARKKEDELLILTDFITYFESTGYFVLVFIVVAIVPALGEELLFRGLIQKYFVQISGNIHIAIWTSALLFSAFHMQFYGFVPRLLLGAFFGYLLAYSGNLIYAMIAHFINNGITLLMVYLYQKGAIEFDIENTESVPLESVAIFFIIGAVLFIVFRNHFSSRNKPTHE